MATENDDDEEIPVEFQTFAERHALEYRQTPPGLALYVGIASLFVGILIATDPEASTDRVMSYVLIPVGVLLLTASFVLHQRKQRIEDELYRRYRRWKREQEGGDASDI